MAFLVLLWYFSILVQNILNYGTAYRLAKMKGDDGISLWGWFFVCNLAALVPGLGIYLWYKYMDDQSTRDEDDKTLHTRKSKALRTKRRNKALHKLHKKRSKALHKRRSKQRATQRTIID